MKKNVELTREDVKILVDRALKGTADPIDHPTLAASPTIPLEPKKEDYPLVQWWYHAKWLALKNGSLAKPDPDGNIPTISLYMEDENGRAIPSGRKIELRKDLYCYWNDLYWAGSTDLRNFGELGLERKEDFRKTFEDRYKWLRLCEGHWKVDQLWVSYFSSWKRPRTSPDRKTKESSPISTTADRATSPPPVNSKRRFEEDETSAEGSSKRQKGKQVDLMAPTTFHHSRPASRKRVHKMAKVMPVSIITSYKHADNTIGFPVVPFPNCSASSQYTDQISQRDVSCHAKCSGRPLCSGTYQIGPVYPPY